ncbi:turripeptide Pal9.2-like [Drosophila pseudoobscura]|uniref:Turripeptide Pal9.2-like n=1 Tax=Drosophila pseudoobscura pseudoobscura TaxID=46245 RepID=A0A6I8VX23_DROPS|nr:turripeptide Pal9.2-like [Drosophila pseudoobscura]
MLLKIIQVVVFSQLLSIVMRALLILSLIALSTSTLIKRCSDPACTLEYSPVCGTDEKGEEHVFGNRCFFKGANCRRKESGLPPLKIIAGDCHPTKRQ